jgi:hypothetical protein
MPVIMATRELWREIGDGAPLANRADVPADSTKLGAWSAKCVHVPEGDFCVAVNETTYLTLAFPLVPLPEFLVAFAFSLGTQLEAFGVSGPHAVAEARPFFEGTAFAKNSNRSLLGTLNDLEFHFSIRIEGVIADPDSLLAVQGELNEIPHVRRPIPFASEATSLLFSHAGSA